MKNKSIRFRITVWFGVVLVLLVGLTFLTIRLAGSVVLRSTVRDYLFGVVEANADNIWYVKSMEEDSEDEAVHFIYVKFEDGYIKIDEDFMNTVNDVNSAVYTQTGEMLYGENPLALETDRIPFAETRLWKLSHNNMDYNIYDRKLNLEEEKTVWVRGIVSEEDNIAKLGQITSVSLFFLPFLVIAAIASGYFLSGKMLAPLRELEKTAESISGRNDLKQRIETNDSGDEITRLANVFNEMIERLDRAFETERRFTSDASHELRTPMAVIRAETEYILEKDRTNEEYREGFDVIKRQEARMSSLIEDMLDYTRMDQANRQYEMAETDLSALVLEISEQMMRIAEKGISLTWEIVPDLFVVGNAMLLSRLIQNLISNAYRYGKENGHILVTLEEDIQDGAHVAVLRVRDDGIGMKEEDLSKIFDRFYRSDASRTTRGTGLGLAMVKRIVELHEAEIRVDSIFGEGSVFTVFFKKA